MIPPLVVLDDIYERWCRVLKDHGPHQITDLTELQTELKELIALHPDLATYPRYCILSSRTPDQALLTSRRRSNVIG